jgi:anti-sigma factor RsiW
MSETPITQADLHAYADGQLDAGRHEQVRVWLLAHPEEQARVQQWQADMASLRAAYDPVLEEPVPLRLMPTQARARWPRALAAGLACVATGLIAGWMARGAMTPAPGNAVFAREALAAHVLFVTEKRHPVEVPAEQEAHLVAWLSKRLDGPIRAPNLQALGFSLLGGRLLPGDQGPLAQLMYQSDAQERLTLTVRRSKSATDQTGFQVLEQKGASVFYWIDRDFGYALSGEIGRDRMLSVARTVDSQLQH